jgi:ketosteroid isomerase-like protein
MNSVDPVQHFLEAINQHDPKKLADLMTEDHVFIDSLDNTVRGREQMRVGWQGYFAFCPDF